MPVNMKKQKISKTTNVAYRKHLQSVAFATKPLSGIHRVAETPDLQKYKSVRFSGHLFKSELVDLIEKTLQEPEAVGKEEETQRAEEDLNCSKEVKKKVLANKKDKDGDYDKEESIKVDTSEKLKATTETEMEDVLFEIKKDFSTFVEIDLRDKVEEKTEDILTESQQHEKEEEPPEIVFQNSWLCCFGFWMKQEKQKAKQE